MDSLCPIFTFRDVKFDKTVVLDEKFDTSDDAETGFAAECNLEAAG